MRIPALVLAATVLASPAQSQEAEVLAAIEDQLSAWSTGDVQGFAAFYTDGVRGFNIDGGPLAIGFNIEMVEMAVQAGFTVKFTPRDIDVKVIGSTAVAVGYLDGEITIPGGEPQSGTWRYSETRVKDGDTWKVVQYHFSKMSAAMAPRR